MKDYEIEKVYKKARKRVEEEKGFYYHLSVYIVINVALLFLKGDYILFSNGVDLETRETIKDAFDKILSVIPKLWSLAILAHGSLVFVRSFFLNSRWEKNKIKKYLNKNEIL